MVWGTVYRSCGQGFEFIEIIVNHILAAIVGTVKGNISELTKISLIKTDEAWECLFNKFV